MLLLLLPPNRTRAQQSRMHTSQVLVRVRVPWGSLGDSGAEEARERDWEGIPGGCLGWAGQGTSLGGQRHHRLFLQQPLPLPHSTCLWSGVWGWWEVATGCWAERRLVKKRPANPGKSFLRGESGFILKLGRLFREIRSQRQGRKNKVMRSWAEGTLGLKSPGSQPPLALNHP